MLGEADISTIFTVLGILFLDLLAICIKSLILINYWFIAYILYSKLWSAIKPKISALFIEENNFICSNQNQSPDFNREPLNKEPLSNKESLLQADDSDSDCNIRYRGYDGPHDSWSRQSSLSSFYNYVLSSVSSLVCPQCPKPTRNFKKKNLDAKSSGEDFGKGKIQLEINLRPKSKANKKVHLDDEKLFCGKCENYFCSCKVKK